MRKHPTLWFLMLVATVMSCVSTGPQPVGGPCTYHNVVFQATPVGYANDSNYIEFRIVSPSDMAESLMPVDTANLDHNEPYEKPSSAVYNLTYKVIDQGTCTPMIFQSIEPAGK